MKKKRILIVDDEKSIRDSLVEGGARRLSTMPGCRKRRLSRVVCASGPAGPRWRVRMTISPSR